MRFFRALARLFVRNASKPTDDFERDPQLTELLIAMRSLAPAHEPSTRLLTKIDGALARIPVGPQRGSVPVPAPLGSALRVGATLAFALILAVTVVITASRLWNSPSVTPEPRRALAATYEALLSVETVRYRLEGEFSPGGCGGILGVPLAALTRWKDIPSDQVPSDRSGAILACAPGTTRYLEEGAYRIDGGSFSAVERFTDWPIAPLSGTTSPPPRERIYVDGVLYQKSLPAGQWQLAEGDQKHAPFSSKTFGGIPFQGLQALQERYQDVAQMDDELVHDVWTHHYRARKIDSYGVVFTVDVWTGRRDGLPRKVTLESREPFSREKLIQERLQVWHSVNTAESAQIRVEDTDVLGDIPAERIRRSTYYFGQFNAPVEIMAPELVSIGR